MFIIIALLAEGGKEATENEPRDRALPRGGRAIETPQCKKSGVKRFGPEHDPVQPSACNRYHENEQNTVPKRAIEFCSRCAFNARWKSSFVKYRDFHELTTSYIGAEL